MKKILSILTILLLVTGLLTGCATKKAKIVIYTSMEEVRNRILETKLKEMFPEYDIAIQHMATGNSAAKIKTEGKNIEADIILGLEVSHMENLKDNFATLSDIDTKHYVEGVNPGHQKYLIWEKYTASPIIDKEYFTKNKLTIPKTYENLLEEKYKGLIAMPNPKTSGTGYMIYLNVVNIMGEEKALTYFDKLSKNVKEFSTSGSGPISLLKQKEVAIAIGLTYQGATEITKGADFQIIELSTGTPYNYTGTSIIDGRETKTGIKEVFTWIVKEFMNYDRENLIPEGVFKDQVNNVPNYPKSSKDANMKNIQDGATKEKLISKWKY